MSRRIADLLPRDWVRHLRGGRVMLGADIASSVKKTSNPSAIAVMEQVGREFIVPFEMRFKSDDIDVFEAALRAILHMIPTHCRGRLMVDSSNEKLLAMRLKRNLRMLIQVDLINGNAALNYGGEKWQAKQLLGSLLCNQYEDKRIAIPPDKWLLDDHRLVSRDGASFSADIAPNGCHADNFDAEKLALWGFFSGAGSVEINAVDTISGSRAFDDYEDTYLERMNHSRFNNL